MSRTYHHGLNWRKMPHDRWVWNEPKWWRRLHKHKKRRIECRKLKHQVLRGNEDVLWPLDKKPWIYYW